ncbi:hypothetical protein SAMD00019534_091120 [Acytostelium subglobosum LB1]|uniref:hypothetical protein n=1 Tax=Acytostelium subglobosum LB1 TaxID=1410327 RepID=UPI0006448E02|nr:hypothetical protein SAMD00019534_091120 [Acytostelium subglobosum LB1]GAM25937.1 hypothetical protein SAMD00019534_091120 [Acytostelium subglobosum LB1]|eukprot:XP_012750980.1 hypothetical protein SAMD00019534_091120 [Acytostelium subglobosum LB1]
MKGFWATLSDTFFQPKPQQQPQQPQQPQQQQQQPQTQQPQQPQQTQPQTQTQNQQTIHQQQQQSIALTASTQKSNVDANTGQGSANPNTSNTAHPIISGASPSSSTAASIFGDFNEATNGCKTVEIGNFSTYKESFYTPTFNLCGANWRLLIFPEGNNSPGNISIFLDYFDIGHNPLLEKDAGLTLTLLNQLNNKKNVRKNSSHKFSFKGVNWGFVSFLSLQTLVKAENGYLIDDKLMIKVEIQSPVTIDNTDALRPKPFGRFSYKMTNFSHHFENFYSPTFHSCGSNWRIYIFPNGYSSPNFFSVYLDLLDVKFKPLMIKHLFFAIEIVNQKYPDRNLKKWVDHLYDDKNMNFGFPKFVLLSTLLNPDNGYMVDDSIQINIEFTVMSSNYNESTPNFEIESNLDKSADCGRFTFHATKGQSTELILSPTYKIAGSKWQVISYPLENLTDFFSIYLDLVDIKTTPLLRKHISFSVEIENQLNPDKHFKKFISNVYSYNSFSWLFQKFIKNHTLMDPKYGFIKNDIIIINVELITVSYDYLSPKPFRIESPLSLPSTCPISPSPSSSPSPNPTTTLMESPTPTPTPTINNNNMGEGPCNFSYDITNFSTLEKSFYSPTFTLNSTNWRFYVFPKGNSAQNFFSLYLDFVDPKTFPKRRQYICFVLSIINKLNPSKSERKYSFHTFCYSSINWGFKKFMSLDTLRDENSGFIENDTISVNVTIHFMSQSNLDNRYLQSYSHMRSSHIQLYCNHRYLNTSGAVDDAEAYAKQKSDEETYYYHTIKLTCDTDFESRQSFDLIDFNKHQTVKIRKYTTLLEFKLLLQMMYGIAFERIRIWFWDNNKSKPAKVSRCPIILDDEDIFNQYISYFGQVEIRLHMEVSNSPTPNEKNLFFDPIQPDHALIFFKYYDAKTQSIEFLTSKVCQANTSISYLVPILNQKLGASPDRPLMLYGDLSMSLVYQLDPNRTLKSYEIGHGDIIYCQRQQQLRDLPRIPFVPDYFNYVYNKTTINFHMVQHKNSITGQPISFQFGVIKTMKYSDIVQRVARLLQAFPQNVILYSVPAEYEPSTGQAASVERKELTPNDKPLRDVLQALHQRVDILYVDVKETYLAPENLDRLVPNILLSYYEPTYS